ncbi:uncharacterized protein LOC111683888 [Lucilia cuprina]|uniref:uncharacterized protein LOC111683888 n=1 Tax=Lucilia cuprina TaxID=7375 RepID=UPI001F05F352|nr:uncharacterized protein LOC111683888 [Lucilia cuprina]
MKSEPYPNYMDDYDYMSPQSRAPQPSQYQPYAKRPISPQIPQYRTPTTASPVEKNQYSAPQMDYLSILKSLKTMWDLYQSFTSSWNTIAERRNREEQLAQQKYKQMQQIRINSKKPPKFNNKKNGTQTTKNPRKQTTTTTTATPILNSSEMYTSSEEEVVAVKKQPLAKVKPRKDMKGGRVKSKNEDNLRDKRQTETADVGEGRYIKGDPLKGYYDFVITEGSYKFWAAFQVGTAILIIYSTFAAIYYSKVNPLVSDYDYTDYLGGARSLSGGDLDFVDDDTGVEKKAQSKSWLEYLPRTGHSLKFILDAIDKLPTDHIGNEGINKEVQDEEENRDENQNTFETEYTDEGGQSGEEVTADKTETSSETKQDNNAM